MSKLGRYSADRKKITALTTTATEIQPGACGTIFMLDGTDYSDTMVHSLPHPSEAGAGWWCKFIVKTAVLDAGSDNCLIKIRAAGASTFVDDLIIILVPEAQADAGEYLQDADADYLQINGEAKGGTHYEFICDGNKYYVSGLTLDISSDAGVQG
tara:strand:+ start:201 stop:665 length:465 start_codon:yes stop_codon:yes gene_type:complete